VIGWLWQSVAITRDWMQKHYPQVLSPFQIVDLLYVVHKNPENHFRTFHPAAFYSYRRSPMLFKRPKIYSIALRNKSQCLRLRHLQRPSLSSFNILPDLPPLRLLGRPRPWPPRQGPQNGLGPGPERLRLLLHRRPSQPIEPQKPLVHDIRPPHPRR